MKTRKAKKVKVTEVKVTGFDFIEGKKQTTEDSNGAFEQIDEPDAMLPF